MNPVLLRLKLDHQEFGQLIDYLEKDMERCLRGEGIDLDVVREFIEYCSDHADQFHHPLEDQLFQCLAARHPESRKLIQSLEQDHLDLRWATRDLQEMLDTIDSTDYVRRDRFLEALGEYLGLFYRHMRSEEMELFPQAERYLADEDWQALSHHMNMAPPSLFGTPGSPQYNRIAEILQQGLA